MRIFNFILALVFALFSIVQYDDPDPIRWILIYGYVAIISLLAAYKKYNVIALGAGILICLIWAITLIPFVRELFTEYSPKDIIESMQAQNPYIEGSREALGLLTCVIVLLFHWVTFRNLKRRQF